MRRSISPLTVTSLVAIVLTMPLIGIPARAEGPVRDFTPDFSFDSVELSAWTTGGAGSWSVSEGNINVTSGNATGASWLASDLSLQDLAAYTKFKCDSSCTVGLLLRVVATPQGGIQGYLIETNGTEHGLYQLELSSDGQEVSRVQLRGGPGMARFAPPEGFQPGATPPVPGIPDPPVFGPPPGARPPGAPGDLPAAGGPQGARGGPPAQLPPQRPAPPGLTDYKAGEWNELSGMIDANAIRASLNWGNQYRQGGATNDEAQSYGRIALYVRGGPGRVEFADVSLRDLGAQNRHAEILSPNFRMQVLDDFYYAWDAAVADINRDGVNDIVAGPFWYAGPDYTNRREIYLGRAVNPSTEFVRNMMTFSYDWNHDGWPDVLATEGRPMVLYVNPQGEPRRWTRYPVAPGVVSETALLEDVDGDGVPELVYVGGDGRVVMARPDPAGDLHPWLVTPISIPRAGSMHGLGVGDINGDGRKDVIQATGWWEQPASSVASADPWVFHASSFARWSRSESAGGGQMGIWDVDGDGLNDVVTSLNAHGWGLAWFKQVRDAAGAISFQPHMIMDDHTTTNAGDLTFSQLHAGVVPADFNGDGIMDFLTGKRHWAHLESYTDPDPNGEPLLVWYRGVRNPDAPGGAEFVPEIIHNRSGVGSLLKVTDVNGDGALDILTSNNRGTFVFWGTRQGQ